MSWEIRLHPEVEAWYLAVCRTEPETGDLIEDAIDQLVHEGPTAGRWSTGSEVVDSRT